MFKIFLNIFLNVRKLHTDLDRVFEIAPNPYFCNFEAIQHNPVAVRRFPSKR